MTSPDECSSSLDLARDLQSKELKRATTLIFSDQTLSRIRTLLTSMQSLIDFPESGFIPFTRETQMTNNFSLFVIVPAIAIDILLLYSLIKQRDIPFDSQFIISTITGDFAFLFMELVIVSLNCKFCAHFLID